MEGVHTICGVGYVGVHTICGVGYGVFTLSEIPVYFYTTSAGGGMDCIHCM